MVLSQELFLSYCHSVTHFYVSQFSLYFLKLSQESHSEMQNLILLLNSWTHWNEEGGLAESKHNSAT